MPARIAPTLVAVPVTVTSTRESADHRPAAQWWGRLRPNTAAALSSDALDAHAGEASRSLTFVERTQARRPLYTSAGGRRQLASIPDDEMHRLLSIGGPDDAGAERQFLTELPEIASDTGSATLLLRAASLPGSEFSCQPDLCTCLALHWTPRAVAAASTGGENPTAPLTGSCSRHVLTRALHASYLT